jgi:hypothetical protein
LQKKEKNTQHKRIESALTAFSGGKNRQEEELEIEEKPEMLQISR